MRRRSGARVLNETRVRVARFGGFSVRLRLIGILIRNLTNSKDDFDNLSIYVRIVYIDFYLTASGIHLRYQIFSI